MVSQNKETMNNLTNKEKRELLLLLILEFIILSIWAFIMFKVISIIYNTL